MQTPPISPTAPLSGNSAVSAVAAIAAAPATADTLAEAAGSEDFSELLARELAGMVGQPAPDEIEYAVGPDPQPAGSEAALQQLLADANVALPGLPLPLPAIQPAANPPVGLSAGLSRTLSAAGPTKPTEPVGQHTLPPPANPGQTAIEPAIESDKAANFAAAGKFLPPVATRNDMLQAGTPLAVPLPEAMLQPQVIATPSATPSVHLAAHVATSGATPAGQAPQIDVRVGMPGWDGALAHKVVWMAGHQQQVAELHLNPPHLGPMEVMLTLGADPASQSSTQASIQFASPHPAVREAIEAALPQLRAMLADNGISLGGATVGADSFQQQAQSGESERTGPRSPENFPQTATSLLHVRSHSGLVDTFV